MPVDEYSLRSIEPVISLRMKRSVLVSPVNKKGLLNKYLSGSILMIVNPCGAVYIDELWRVVSSNEATAFPVSSNDSMVCPDSRDTSTAVYKYKHKEKIIPGISSCSVEETEGKTLSSLWLIIIAAAAPACCTLYSWSIRCID